MASSPSAQAFLKKSAPGAAKWSLYWMALGAPSSSCYWMAGRLRRACVALDLAEGFGANCGEI